MSAPTPPPPAPKNSIVFLALVAVVAAVVGGVLWSRRATTSVSTVTPSTGTTESSASSGGSKLFDAPNRPAAVFAALEALESTEPLFWVDVLDPRATHGALHDNPWLDKAFKDPLGQGFLEAWGGFFGTRGQDIGATFEGNVLDMLTSKVLDKPYRISWFGGSGAKGAPALVVPAPTMTARAAFDALVAVAGSGGFQPPPCEGGTAEDADGGATVHSIHRVVLADKTLFIAKYEDRMVVSTGPQAAQLALCQPLAELKPKDGTALSVGVSLKQGGRGTQSLGDLLGVSQSIAFDFGVEQQHFVPKGVQASVEGQRLATVEPSPALLKSIPASAGVVFFLAVKLPEPLTAQSLRDTLAAEGENFKGTRKKWPLGAERQVAVVWNPKASNDEVAVLWANPKDEEVLATAMSHGKRALQKVNACSMLAFATQEFTAVIEATCKGKSPSMLDAAPPIVAGLKQSASLSLTVNVGRVLSQLTLDGYVSEHPSQNSGAGPQEIEAARRLLEELPSLGFTGAARSDGSLTSGGFRS